MVWDVLRHGPKPVRRALEEIERLSPAKFVGVQAVFRLGSADFKVCSLVAGRDNVGQLGLWEVLKIQIRNVSQPFIP